MKISNKNLVFTSKSTSIHNLFSNHLDKNYKNLINYLSKCEESFIFDSFSGGYNSIHRSLVDISSLSKFLSDRHCDKETKDLLNPLLIFATSHQIDEIIF